MTSSLSLSFDSIDVQGCPGEIIQRHGSRSSSSTPRRNRPKTCRGQVRKTVSTIVKGFSGQPSRGLGSEARTSVHHQEMDLHHHRSQTVAVGVDPFEYGRMVAETQNVG